MAEYRRVYGSLTKAERNRLSAQMRKRGYKLRSRKDPNGRYEIWVLGGKG